MEKAAIRIDRYRGLELLGTRYQPISQKNTGPALSGSKPQIQGGRFRKVVAYILGRLGVAS